MWKERLWQVFLVAILGLVLTMCSRSGGNNNSSSSSNANAEETSTVSVSSMPSLKVESLPSMTIIMDNSSATPVAVTSFPTVTLDNSSATPVAVTSFPTVTVILANAGPSAISHTMFCSYSVLSGSNRIYYYCDASDDTVFPDTSYTDGISHDAAFAAGWKLVGPGCSTGATSRMCYLFHK